MPDIGPFKLENTYVRIRPDASVEPLHVDETFWQRLISGALGTFHKEFLVSHHAFTQDWDSWEVHPNGDEIVCLLTGRVTMMMESPGENRTADLAHPGEFVIVPKGTWHTAKVLTPATMLFITAGEGTEHRPV